MNWGAQPVAGIALSLAWVAVLGQLVALIAGRYAPYPAVHERGLGPGRRAVRTLVLARRRRRSVRVDQVGAPARRPFAPRPC